MTIIQARNVGLPLMKLIRLKGVPILQQLHLEEQLLRTSSRNRCIINDGTDAPNIVMDISGKPAELLDIDMVLRDQVPVVKRFTGGGTVTVDHGTVFVTFICNRDAVPDLQLYPRPIMSWSGQLYSRVFQGIGDFQLRENDYVFGNRKFGGNAQSITKNRWIHHTSFLWDFEVSNMAYLKHPKRAPEYRLARNHLEFICRMKDYMPRSVFIDRTVEAIGMMQNPQYRQQLEGMLTNMKGSTEWDNRMMDSLKNFDLSSPEVKEQFDQIGLTPEQVISKIMENPDVAMAFQNPRVQAAIMDCSQNPMSMVKYQNDKEVMDVFNKISELFPGVSGSP